MLIKCKECGLQVSDKAASCPHCGYPLRPDSPYRKARKSNRRKRLPNGFGQISEIKGQNLRNPFRAMITIGKNDKGRPICSLLKPVSFFKTYNDAYSALLEYHRNPYEVDTGITVKELYDRWSDEYFKTISSTKNIVSAWRYCSAIYNMRVADVRIRHIKGCMNDGTFEYKGEVRHASANVKKRIKSLFNMMLDYAYEYEMVDQNYCRNFNLPNEVSKEVLKVEKEHIAFTDEELNILWKNVGMEWVDVVLIQTYSGWRPQELGLLEIENVDLKEWTFCGGIKTDAGTNRIVPIHPMIRDFVKSHYDKALKLNSKYLFNCTDTCTKRSSLRLNYSKYKNRFLTIVDELKLNPGHRSHDPRKTFVTKAKYYNVNEYAIKYMVGHSITDLTEKVYTERDIGWLRTEIEKIK